MQFLQLFGALTLAAAAYAQTFAIAAPFNGQGLTVGQPFTVEIDQPDTLGPLQPVSVVIGLESCGTTACSSVQNDQILGDILFAGDYSPKRHEDFKPPYQNFTFTLPQGWQNGKATLHVVEFFLEGAGPFPEMLAKNVSVTVSSAAKSGAKFKRSLMGQ